VRMVMVEQYLVNLAEWYCIARRDIPGSIPKPEIATSASSGTSNQASSNPLGEVYDQHTRASVITRLTSWHKILRLLDNSESSSRPATTQEAYIPLAIHPSPTSLHDFSSHSWSIFVVGRALHSSPVVSVDEDPVSIMR